MAASEESKVAFVEPKREIFQPQDVAKWESSQAYHDLVEFILLLGEAVKNKKTRVELNISENCLKLIEVLDTMDKWIEEIPPVEQPQRFGNKAFRDWFDKMEENSEAFVKSLLSEEYQGATVELRAYFKDSFGNRVRIDYGTGHEASFVCFLCCLFKLRILQDSEKDAIVLRIFNRYLSMMRKLQNTYRMEPAGSQGVWGLDDFQFLPFIWGSAQLIGHRQMSPKAFLDSSIVDSFYKDYMFLDCVRFINTMKSGPFHEHSNILWNISGVPNWGKVNSGLVKMYKAEVLSKFPVIQHFVFGNLMSIEPAECFKKPPQPQ
ncbi:serine/threonine-protein phosphatase 2A activator isoform X2 [Nematostella vectensis]|uniref:serine/threonine-protein phosphatase 2A activator isoform X2 n=1 Tax=Nematostella vectensis TaxID=45351 RepID=UPI0020774463|nr:serine/threonine-protein phosphatase 2A activator isoform X2 [Nematostella vectensis]XP_048587101.1 serine/threonine-protein phosphatase 2A activator isoform X2 [Nematostella vectensis]XP_048587102.1 serine/threonine-protein phosphatase 2A activator isoform X2 [Nematostella vectensis]XP_048587103.1 serine/threonine-protein phosphatase 2A activator isoform X2 [Nematostella vectensis]